METVIVHLMAATICWANQCHPALIGPKTPQGTFILQHRRTSDPGYGGDVLAFAKDDTGVYAVHRVWTLKPKQRRLERLRDGDASSRKDVTDGCINVMPSVYDELVSCCSKSTIIIEP